MYVVTYLNLKTGERFDKEFDNFYVLCKHIHKCKYSKKVKVIGIQGLREFERMEIGNF